MVGLFPKGELLDMVLLAEMKAMIGPNDDDRVPGMSSPEPFLRLHQLCCSLRQIVPIFFLEKRLGDIRIIGRVVLGRSEVKGNGACLADQKGLSCLQIKVASA